MAAKKSSTQYYLRDEWVVKGATKWARRDGFYATKKLALSAARELAKGIGKGARVQVVSVTTTIEAEVKP